MTSFPVLSLSPFFHCFGERRAAPRVCFWLICSMAHPHKIFTWPSIMDCDLIEAECSHHVPSVNSLHQHRKPDCGVWFPDLRENQTPQEERRTRRHRCCHVVDVFSERMSANVSTGPTVFLPAETWGSVCRMASSPKKSNISVNTLSVRIIPNPNRWPRFLIPNFVSLSLTLFPVLESSYHVFINVEFHHINAASFRLFLYLCSSAPSTNLLFIWSDPWKWIKFDRKFWEEIKKNKKLNRHRHTHSHKHTLSLVVPLMLDLLRSCQCSASSHYSPSPHISLFIPLSSPLVVFHSVTHTHSLFLTKPSLIYNSFCCWASPEPLGPANPLTWFLQPFLTVNHGYEPIENAGLPESAHRSRAKKKKTNISHILWNLYVLSSSSWKMLKGNRILIVNFCHCIQLPLASPFFLTWTDSTQLQCWQADLWLLQSKDALSFQNQHSRWLIFII